MQHHGNPSLTSNAEEAEQFYEDLQDLLKLTPKKYILFIIGDWNAKVGSQETRGVTGKFGLGVQNEKEKEKENGNWKRNAKGKLDVLGGLINSCEKKRNKKQRRKGKIFPLECRVPKNSKER